MKPDLPSTPPAQRGGAGEQLSVPAHAVWRSRSHSKTLNALLTKYGAHRRCRVSCSPAPALLSLSLGCPAPVGLRSPHCRTLIAPPSTSERAALLQPGQWRRRWPKARALRAATLATSSNYLPPLYGAFVHRPVASSTHQRCRLCRPMQPCTSAGHAASSAAARPGRPPSRRVHCSSGRLIPFCPGSCCPSFS